LLYQEWQAIQSQLFLKNLCLRQRAAWGVSLNPQQRTRGSASPSYNQRVEKPNTTREIIIDNDLETKI
jgi:hypothetical protein